MHLVSERSIFVNDMVSKVQCLLVFTLLVGNVFGIPVSLNVYVTPNGRLGEAAVDGALYHDPEPRPLAAMSELTSRLVARAQREQDARLPLPSPQDLEAIKKVAQILIMLGEQVIPTIIGEPQPANTSSCEPTVEDVPNDTVNTST